MLFLSGQDRHMGLLSVFSPAGAKSEHATATAVSPDSTLLCLFFQMAHGGVQVVVTGAGGKTGGSVFRKLQAQPGKYQAVALVRSEQVGPGSQNM